MRVSDKFATAMHVGVDEFNAAGLSGKAMGCRDHAKAASLKTKAVTPTLHDEEAGELRFFFFLTRRIRMLYTLHK